MFFAETALLLNVDEETRRAIVAAGGYDVEMAKKAIAGLSFLANRHDYLFRSSRLQDFFKRILSGVNTAFPTDAVADLQVIVLDCINNFLVDEEKTAEANDSNCELDATLEKLKGIPASTCSTCLFFCSSGLTQSKQESLKDLGDTRDVHGSTVVQIYLQTALEHCVTSVSTTVRTKALTLIATAMRQGLMMPFPFIAALICLQTDVENNIKSRAVTLLQEIAQQHCGFLAVSVFFLMGKHLSTEHLSSCCLIKHVIHLTHQLMYFLNPLARQQRLKWPSTIEEWRSEGSQRASKRLRSP